VDVARRYYVLRNNVVEKVLKLLNRREKWLVAAAVRFLRTCIGLRDDFYNRYLVRSRIPEMNARRLMTYSPNISCSNMHFTWAYMLGGGGPHFPVLVSHHQMTADSFCIRSCGELACVTTQTCTNLHP
jgi:hypothetical protein